MVLGMKPRLAAVSAGAAILALGLCGCGPYFGAYSDDGLVVAPDSATCFIEPGTGDSVVQFAVQARESIQFEPTIVGFRLEDAPSIAIVGDEVLPPGVAPYAADATPLAADVTRMAKNLDKAILDATIAHDAPSTVVLLLRSASDRPIADNAVLRVYWGGGEPVYVQDLDLSALLTCGPAEGGAG